MLKIQVVTFPGKEDKPMDMNVLAFSLEICFFGFCVQKYILGNWKICICIQFRSIWGKNPML